MSWCCGGRCLTAFKNWFQIWISFLCLATCQKLLLATTKSILRITILCPVIGILTLATSIRIGRRRMSVNKVTRIVLTPEIAYWIIHGTFADLVWEVLAALCWRPCLLLSIWRSRYHLRLLLSRTGLLHPPIFGLRPKVWGPRLLAPLTWHYYVLRAIGNLSGRLH